MESGKLIMKKYDDLELVILSCLLQKPELMEKTILEDKHFVRTQRIWKFMKAFYKKFKNFDIPLMTSVASNKYKIMEYVIVLMDIEPNPNLLEVYEKQLIELWQEKEKDKWLVDKIFTLSNDLITRNMSTTYFKEEIDKLYDRAEELFK
jgi:hypothetical protein